MLPPATTFPPALPCRPPGALQLLAWAAAKPGRFILEDDYDSEFRFATRPLPSLQGMSGANGPVVYLTTFSKSLAPGMRIALHGAAAGATGTLPERFFHVRQHRQPI